MFTEVVRTSFWETRSLTLDETEPPAKHNQDPRYAAPGMAWDDSEEDWACPFRLTENGKTRPDNVRCIGLLFPLLRAGGGSPLQIQREKPFQDLLVGKVRFPAVGGKDRLVEPLVGQIEPGGALVV